VASRTRSFQMAFSCGDGYAHRWARHLMMMMNSAAAHYVAIDCPR